jgi:hypothetical protein
VLIPKIVDVLGAAELDDRQQCEAIAQLGVVCPTSRSGEGATGWDVAAPGHGRVTLAALGRIRDALPQWQGRRFSIEIPVRREGRVGGLPVYTRVGSGDLFIVAAVPIEFPGGGVASYEALDRAKTLAEMRAAGRVTNTEVV